MSNNQRHKKKWKHLITSAAIKWQGMVPTKDLMLFEEIQDYTKTLCDMYGYPYCLLIQPEGTTFSNKNAKQ